jgi:RimJ/RimL family protein N-acetyltransferase
VVRVFVATERLLLRQFTEADAGLLLDLDGDPEVMRFLTKGQSTPLTVIQEQLLPRFLGYYERFEARGYWAAVEQRSGQFLGWLALEPPGDGRLDAAELGYRLRRSAWGKGYATEASRALIQAAFTDPGLQRVWAQTMAVNTASRRVMEKAGLRYVRTFYPTFADPIDGTELGEVEYALERADYQRSWT